MLLRAAGSHDPSVAIDAWREYRGLVPDGGEAPPERRLLPAVFRNVVTLGRSADESLLRAYAESFGANAQALRAAAAAVRTLAEAGVPTLLLKGTALLVSQYHDTGVRPMADIDILVPSESVSRALDALDAAGWTGDPARSWLLREAHAGVLIDSSGRALDLHRHALFEARFAKADNEFFGRSREAGIDGAPCRVMAPADQFIHTIIHGLRWSIAPSGVWMLDALTIVRNGVDPASVRTVSESLDLVLPVRRGVDLLRSVFAPGGPFEDIADHLGGGRTSHAARVEHWFRVREPSSILGALPNLWFAYLRSGPPGQVGSRGFPGFLARFWGLDGPRQLPATMLRKLGRRVVSAF